MESHFNGWLTPGPVPPGAHLPVDVPADETLDAISGHFRIFQLRKGHRFSSDDLLTAWYGTTWAPRAGRVLDLGSGIGSVGMIAAWRMSGAHFVTIEAQEESVRLARYFPVGAGVEGDHPQKVACRFEQRGDITDYAAAAATHAQPGGFFACVYPEERRDRLEAAAQAAGFTVVRRRPVVFREGEPPLVSLFGMMRAADLPAPMRARTWIEPPLVIRSSDGAVDPEYAAVKLSVGFPP